MKAYSIIKDFAIFLISILTFIFGGTIINYFDKPAVYFSYDGAIDMQKLDEVFRGKLEKKELNKIPNSIQVFNVQNKSFNKDINELRYSFNLPGNPCHYEILDGKEHVESNWTKDKGKLILDISSFNPDNRITGAICYRTNINTNNNLELPTASAPDIAQGRLLMKSSEKTGNENLNFYLLLVYSLAAVLLAVALYGFFKRFIKAQHEIQDSKRIFNSWAEVQRISEKFANNGSGKMFWYKVPLGGLEDRDGFKNLLGSAINNKSISRISFVVDISDRMVYEKWLNMVVPRVEEWGTNTEMKHFEDEKVGYIIFNKDSKNKRYFFWKAENLCRDYSPCFSIFLDDPNQKEKTIPRALIYLSTQVNEEITSQNGNERVEKNHIPESLIEIENDKEVITSLRQTVSKFDNINRYISS